MSGDNDSKITKTASQKADGHKRKKKSFDLYEEVTANHKSKNYTSEEAPTTEKTKMNHRSFEEVRDKGKSCKALEEKINKLSRKKNDACETIRNRYLKPVWDCINYIKENDADIPKGMESNIKLSFANKKKTEEEYSFQCSSGLVNVKGYQKTESKDHYYEMSITMGKITVLEADFRICHPNKTPEVTFHRDTLKKLKYKDLIMSDIEDDLFGFSRSIEYDVQEKKETDLKNKLKDLEDGIDFN